MVSSNLFAPQTAMTTPQSKIQLGYVKNGDIGCGCSFARNKTDLRQRRYIYSESMDEPAYINVNGKNLKLQPVASSDTKTKERVGQRSWETFTAKGLKIRLDKTVTWVCPPKDEACEVTYYKATLTVSGKGQTITETLTGNCGC